MHTAAVRLLAVVALACIGPVVTADTYKWVDASGQVHYSDTPPAGIPYEVIRTPTSTPATPAEPLPERPPVVSPAGTVPVQRAPQHAGTSAADSARDRACVDALYQSALLNEKRRAYRPGPGGTRTYLADDARPAELERLARERDANCSDDPATRSSQERRAAELGVTLSPDCQTSRGKLDLMLDPASRTPDSEIERQRDYLKEHCPGEDRADLWMADWMVVHPPRR
jgi:hypothetical protein